MAVKARFVHFNTRSGFDSVVPNPELNSANGNEYFNYIVFIKNTKEIYTHGEFYNCSDTGSSDIDQIIKEIQNNINTLESNINTLEADKVDSEDFSNLVSEVEENEEVTAKALTELNNVKASKVDVDELINQIKDLINLKEDRLSCDDFKTINGECILGEGEINIVEPDHFRTNPTVQQGTIQTVSVNGDGHVTSITARSLTSTDIPDLDASKISSGTISIDRLPAGALERLYTVATESAAMSLTIQEGDVVRVTGNGNKMYFCVSNSATTFASKFTEFTAGSATSVPWSGITDKPVGIDGWGDRIGVIEGTYAKTTDVNSLLTEYLPKSSISDWALASEKPTIKKERLTNLDLATPWTAFYTSFQPLNRPEENYFSGFTLTNVDFRGTDNTYLVQLMLSHSGKIHTRYRSGGSFKAWNALAFTSDIPTKLSQLTDDVVAGKYLPKSGGTLSGVGDVLTIQNPNKGDVGIKLDRNGKTSWEIVVTGGNLKFVDLASNTTQFILNEISQSSIATALFGGNVKASTFIGNLTGNADSATKLANKVKIWGQEFDGTSDITDGITIKSYKDVGTVTSLSDLGDAGLVLSAVASRGGWGMGMWTEANGQGYIQQQSFSGLSYALCLQPLGGNVAIGGTSATEKFHVHGNAKATKFIGALQGNADSATKATQDGSGNVITSTYATNTYSTINIGSTAIASNSKTGTFTIVAGSNITLTPDATNKKVTIAATNTTYNVATTSANGLMSASDKSKLDGIAAGAQVNSITGVKGNAESNYRTGNVNITAANLGITVINNTKDADKNVKSATTASTCTGNAATATKLQTSRSIWGQSFDGSGNITGNFTTTGNITASGTLTLNGTTISYDKTKNAFVLPANLVVQGDVACTSTLSSFDPNTITESVMIDGSTIKRNSNGTLYVNSSALGTIPTKLSQLTDDVVSGHYLPTSGGTINGNLVTLGTINANGITVNGTVRATSFISDIFRNMPLSEFNAASVSIDPNKYYRLTTAQSSLTITLNTPADNTILNEYFIEFPCGGSVSLPSGLIWANGKAPEFESGATYQISIVNNLAIFTKFVS